MLRPCPIHNAPANLQAFIDEILPPFEALYGTAAAAFYRQTAASGIKATIARPELHAYGCMEDDDAAALLFVREEGDRRVIAFFHVRLPYRGLGAAEALLGFVLRDLGTWPGTIFTEFIAFHPMALDAVFQTHGFTKVDRQIMRRRPWQDPAQAPEGFQVHIADGDFLPELAAVLVETYASHEEQFLFPEAQTQANAETYLNRVRTGSLGLHQPAYTIAAWQDRTCAGFIVGSQVLPGLGFTLHLAVRPAFQGRGLGRALLGTLAAAFAVEGLDYIALGVTCDNPAVFLYQRAGFDCLAQVPVYHRPGRRELDLAGGS